MNRRILPVLVLVVSQGLLLFAGEGSAGKPAPALRTFGAGEGDATFDTGRFLFSPEVVADAKDGTVRLAHSVLVADEIGATDFHQTETLGEAVQAKKVFRLDSAEVTGAELFLFGGAKQIRVNGLPLAGAERLPSTGWTCVKVPPALLKAGDNEVIFSGGGQLLLEPGRQAGRSFKSTDGGRTWANQTLGDKSNQQGEYLVRLRLGRYAPHGWALSPVFDLWAPRAGDIAAPGKIVSVHSLAGLGQGQPDGTSLTASLRTGSTPTPEAKTWTAWHPLDKDYRPAPPVERHRWAQLKFDLATTRPHATPRIPPRFALAFELQRDPAADDKLEVVAQAGRPHFALGSVPFIYQEPSPRLKLLRERYRLDQVIAHGKTEMEQLMLLRHWVRNQWHTAWGANAAAWMPPWDALIILEAKDQPDCLTMCTHYAAVFTQCCLALGWNARHCILDHHCVAEVWVDQHRKWVMMDAGNSKERPDANLHFERAGVPLSALELHLAQRSGKTEGITVHFTPARLMEAVAVLCRPAPRTKDKGQPRPDMVPLTELAQYPVCQLNNYRRYAFPGRNNYLSSLLPGELYQGWSEYFYDGYYWVGDSPDEPTVSPEYSRLLSPARSQDIDWSLNWTRIHLSRTRNPGELRVELETFTPNLARLERSADAGGKAESEAWQATPAAFVWKLKPGTNALRARAVNRWDRAGAEARVQVQWTPGR
jgi:hypothetical protein